MKSLSSIITSALCVLLAAPLVTGCGDDGEGAGGSGDGGSNGDGGSSSDGGGSSEGGGSGDGGSAADACEEGCAENGFGSGEPDGEGCVCDEPNDAECSAGMEAFCECDADIGQPCDGQKMFNIYVTCFTDFEGARATLVCIGEEIGDGATCDDAANACPSPGGGDA